MIFDSRFDSIWFDLYLHSYFYFHVGCTLVNDNNILQYILILATQIEY